MSPLCVLAPRALSIVLLLVATGCDQGSSSEADAGGAADAATRRDLAERLDLPVRPDLAESDGASPTDLAAPPDLALGVTCSPACGAGQHEVSPCTTTADRVCAACTAIADCDAITCTTATDQTCITCSSDHYLDGGTCAACGGACPAGTYETAACTPTADRVCSGCTAIAHCTDEICTTATDQSCTTCDAGFYASGGTCQACSATCPSGTYRSAACSATADLACVGCAPIAHCAAAICTTASDQTCTACNAGFYLHHGVCLACSGACPLGQQQSAACTATSDRSCTSCTVIPNCTAETCTTTTDQVCTACAGGFYLSGNTCVACSGACGAGQYQSGACGGSTDRTCTNCTPIPGCIAETCTTASDQACTTCAPGSYLSGGLCHACSGGCGAGTYQSAACSATSDRLCTPCTGLANCAAEVCTTAFDSTCTACASGTFLSGGLCNACSGACGVGSYQSAACSAAADRQCSPCTVIPSCTSETCTTSSNQVCSACTGGSYLAGGTCHGCSSCAAGQYQTSPCTATTDAQCAGCSSCTAQQYVSTACGATADTACTDCPAHCTSCTSSTACTACDSGYSGVRCDIHPAGTYRFDELGGTTLVDAGPGGNDGAVGGASRTTGPECHSGRCLTFAGVHTASIPLGADNRFGTDDFTIGVWIDTSHSGTEDVILGNHVCSGGGGYLLAVVSGKAGLAMFGAGGTGSYILSSADVNDGAWHFLVAQRSGTTVSLAVDGAVVGSAAVDPAYDVDAGTPALDVGNIHGGCGGYGFVGALDELTLSRGALDDAALAALRAAPITFREDFDRLAPGSTGSQCATGDAVYAFSSLSGWDGSGLNALHAVAVGAGDSALTLYDSNVAQLAEGVAANETGKQYQVSFDLGATVWNDCAQATDVGDALRIDIVRANDTVLASQAFQPGAWAGAQTFMARSFSYTGDGSGPVRFRVSPELAAANHFGGAIDNFAVMPQ